MNDDQDKAVLDGDNNPAADSATGEKTFTQADLDRIISERLNKEKSKLESTLAEREQGIQRKEFELSAKIKLQEKGLPIDLLSAMNTTSEEAFNQALEVMEQRLKKEEAPKVVYTGSPLPHVSLESQKKLIQQMVDEEDEARKAMGLNGAKKRPTLMQSLFS